MASDLDLIMLSATPERYGAWLGTAPPFGPADLLRSQPWGALTEWRFRQRSGLVLEVGVTTLTWAARPLDPGTARVLGNGFRIVYDPDGNFEQAALVCAR